MLNQQYNSAKIVFVNRLKWKSAPYQVERSSEHRHVFSLSFPIVETMTIITTPHFIVFRYSAKKDFSNPKSRLAQIMEAWNQMLTSSYSDQRLKLARFYSAR